MDSSRHARQSSGCATAVARASWGSIECVRAALCAHLEAPYAKAVEAMLDASRLCGRRRSAVLSPPSTASATATTLTETVPDSGAGCTGCRH